MKADRFEGARVRALLYRLLATQGALLIGVLLLLAVFGRGDAELALALGSLALLPVVVSLVGLVYYSRVSALAKSGGYSREADARLTKRAYQELGMGLAAWVVVLALILVAF